MALGSVKQALVAEVGVDLGPLKRGLNRANRLAGRAGRGLKTAFKAAGAAAAAMGAAIAAAMTRGVQKAAEFQGEMRKLETLVGENSQQVEQWRDDILALAPAVGKGPKELSEAMFAITSGGIEGAEALDVLRQSAKASAQGLGNMTSIGRTAASALNAFGDEGLTAQAAIDKMVATVREGNVEASELTGALGDVIGIADSMGVSFGEMNSFIATYTRLGVDAQKASTALRATLNSLAKPTTDQREAFQELGTSVQGFRKEIQQKGLAAALADLVVRSEGNIETMARLIPNVRALSGVLGAAGSQGEEFQAIQARIQDSLGTTNEGFRKASKDLKLLIQRLKAAKDVLLIEVGESLTPFVQRLLKPENIKLAADIFIGSVQAMITAIQALIEAARRGEFVVRKLLAAFGVEQTEMTQLAEAQNRLERLKELREGLASGARETVGAAGIKVGLPATAGLEEVQNQIEATRNAIDKPGGLADSFTEMNRRWERSKDILGDAKSQLAGIDTGALAGRVSEGAAGGESGAGGGGGRFSGIVAAAEGVTRPLDTIQTTSQKIRTELVDIAQVPLNSIIGLSEKWNNKLDQVGETLATTISRQLGDMIDEGESFLDILGSIGKTILTQVAGPLTKALQSGQGLGNALSGILGGGKGGLGGVLGTALGSFIPGGGIIGSVAGSILGGIFQSGGFVQGRGAVPIMAHGGEAVLTSGAVDMLGPARIRRLNQRSGPSRRGADTDAARERSEDGEDGRPVSINVHGGRSDIERQVLRAVKKLKRRGAL